VPWRDGAVVTVVGTVTVVVVEVEPLLESESLPDVVSLLELGSGAGVADAVGEVDSDDVSAGGVEVLLQPARSTSSPPARSSEAL
jgi:hypothetical protein